jgi:hypothetical protein
MNLKHIEMKDLLLSIASNARKNYKNQSESLTLAALEELTDLSWKISTCKKIIERIESDIVNYTKLGIHDYVKTRLEHLEEQDKELKELQKQFNSILSILNK